MSGVLRFPDRFLWGAATAAYQIEGGAAEDGRGVSIWDTFSRSPGRVRNGDTGDTAADHYHRWREDVTLMRDLGLRAYRFSVAWPRVQATGSGPANQHGLDFYRRLVDALREADIEPFVTLYHWDLPQTLQDAGGWPARDTAYRFAEYASLVFDALGDRVTYWSTLNEPWCSAFLGYGTGQHAPGIRDEQQAVTAAHHLLLAHGLALEVRPAGGKVGIVLNPAPVRAAASDDATLEATQIADGMQNRLFLDAIFKARYPADVLDHLAQRVDLGHIRAGDEAVIAQPIDVLGVNYYQPLTIASGGVPANLTPEMDRTALGWDVDADGLEELLLRIRADYGPIPIVVTENGAAYDDNPDSDGYVHDDERVAFLDQHLRAAHRAVAAGLELRGYFVWSLLDNFEWAEGYTPRFGLVYVDYETQERIPKASARWYQQVIAANGLTLP
jgi:beta-glucosidase